MVLMVVFAPGGVLGFFARRRARREKP